MPVMNVFPRGPGAQVGLANWRQSPCSHRALRPVREVVPSAVIRRGTSSWRLPRACRHIAATGAIARELGA